MLSIKRKLFHGDSWFFMFSIQLLSNLNNGGLKMSMKNFLAGIGLISLLAVVLVGCNGTSGEPKTSVPPTPTATVTVSPSKAPEPTASEPAPSPFVKIEAEKFSAISDKNPGKKDIIKKNITIGEGEQKEEFEIITAIKNGAWARYDQVNFGADTDTGAITFEARLAAGKAAAALSPSNRKVELRLDDPTTGTLIGSFTIDYTGNGVNWLAYEIKSCKLTNVTGVHDLYLVFSCREGVLSVMDMDWFQLCR